MLFYAHELQERLLMKIQVGTIIEFESNNYIIKERIDQGGNGTVWKAEAPGKSGMFAIKVLCVSAYSQLGK